jgi:signal transduction histidine kinase
MNFLAIILIILIIIFSIIIFIKLRSYKKQIRDITAQIKEFKDRKTNKKINTQMADKDIEKLACEINEYLELYKRNEQEKVAFENTLKQGIANMSHDLRTPLTSIIGYLKLLQNDEIDKEEALAVLKNKTNKLNVLINDFFELASVESEEYELDITRVNLTNIVQEEILSLYEAFESRGFEPKINISDKPIFIMGDKDSLERIVDNLLSNTLKYAEGDIKINLEEASSKVVLSISNSCTTLGKEDVAHIFDRFYMADQVRKGQGVGLGLSIVKSLIEKMNGNITARLEEDELSIICKWKVK